MAEDNSTTVPPLVHVYIDTELRLVILETPAERIGLGPLEALRLAVQIAETAVELQEQRT